MARDVLKQRCQHIGCDCEFAEEENVENCCRFHPGPPVFHDGSKEWSCCKQKSHDFTIFLAIPGCQTGKHTNVKQQQAVMAVPNKRPIPDAAQATAGQCSRCKQGFICSDHGSKLSAKVTNPALVALPKKTLSVQKFPKIVDLNAKQTCRNKGCGMSYTEKENTATSCLHHPGPVVFHDRQRGGITLCYTDHMSALE